MAYSKKLADISKTDSRIESYDHEFDGWNVDSLGRDRGAHWVYLKPGFSVRQEQLHTIHENTIAKVLYVLKNVIPCHCDECNRLSK